MASKSKINWYAKYATEHLVVATDERGLYCEVVSENIEGVSYRVDMDEKTMQAKSCNCKSYKPCKHMRIATEALASATPVVEETKITEIEAGQWYILNSNTQVFKTEDGRWMAVGPTENGVEIVEAHIAKQQAIAEAEQIVASPVVTMPTPEVVASIESDEHTTVPVTVAASDGKKLANILAEQKVDLGLVGSLTRNQGFHLMR